MSDLVRHLVGLQAQENLPPYLSLHARLTSLDPYDVTRALEERRLVRLLTMRGTIHLLAPEDALALRPWVRLLGAYDNLWLSHADRDRVTTPENRRRWMGTNGGIGSTVFVDGMLEGLWRHDDGRVRVEQFRPLTREETADPDAEVARVEALLAA